MAEERISLSEAARRSGVGRPEIGAVVGEKIVPVGRALSKPPADMMDLIARWDALKDEVRRLADAGAGAQALREAELLAPIKRPGKIMAMGLNYADHVAETGAKTPEHQIWFCKQQTAVNPPFAPVQIPKASSAIDYEVELVFVIGKHVHGAKKADAFGYVAGITILNDLTCRDTQKREVASGSRFWTAKNAPGFGPLGPYIITMDEVPDPYDIWVTCSVNGELRMRVDTSDQIWKLPDIIEHFSRLLPLEPGDMFSTGAPGGVAVGKPNAEALFLNPGDVVECAFEKPKMALRTRIIAPR